MYHKTQIIMMDGTKKQQATINTQHATQNTHTKMTTRNNDTMEYTGTESLLRLLLIEKNLSTDLRGVINEKATIFLKDLDEDVAKFISNDELDEEHYDEDDIRTLVQCVPGALSLKDDEYGGAVPIYNVCMCENYSFIPVLAEEGMKINVGGDGMRGGLLCKDNIGGSVLKEISCNNRYRGDSEHYAMCDSRSLDVIKRLREIGLFEKEDIRKYNLLWRSCNEWCSKRFNYFADWDPSALKDHNEGDTLLHSKMRWCVLKYSHFQLALSATLRHYPRELGLLLVKDDKGKTPFQMARNEFGKEKAWKAIKKCLDESSGGSRILGKNPQTNMYPFMFAAAGDTCELDLVYYLVRRNPISLLLSE